MITWPWQWRRRALTAESRAKARAKAADALVETMSEDLEEAKLQLDIVTRENAALIKQVRTMSER